MHVELGSQQRYPCNSSRIRDMNDHEHEFLEDDKTPSTIEELKRRKAQLENENSDLSMKLQEGQRLKTKLQESRKDGKKLVHNREKLKNLKSERQETSHNVVGGYQKKVEDESEATARDEPPTDTAYKEEHHSITAPLITEIHALKLENSMLVKGKRKVEEQRDSVVQELAALNTKHDKLLGVCNRLESEIHRLSSLVVKSKSQTSEQEEGIEILKEQLRCYQEDIKSLQGELQSTKRSNEQMKTELNEARLVIRDMRRQPPSVQVYPAAAMVEPVYRTYDERGYRYGREPLGYAMMRTYSGECLMPMRDANLRRGTPSKKAFLTPDETAVVDNEVVDHSLASSKSI
ncbi:lamin-like protein [Actinia tenebrosa]|uniref:Lamin-like protein n=1 Tax=Actinia tenebrosa TaxID=6105 RepID=A0A6P8H9K8_ACTTE|nr:lamin-like protein [Actinia tenebrosa]